MVATESLSTAIILSVILTANIVVEGSRETCPSSAIVDLTGEKPDSSGSINKTGIVFTKNSTWEENGRPFGCLCHFKPCVPFCCPLGYALNTDGCVEDEFSFIFSIHERSIEYFHAFVNDPCHLTSADHASWGKFYNSSENGLMELENHVNSSSGRLCLVRGENLLMYWIGICNSGDTSFGFWPLGCMSVSLLFSVATFVVYSVTPELKNLHGLIFRSYLASYICCMILLTIFMLSEEIMFLDFVAYIITVLGLQYFGTACMFWLNVMSFDVWQKFRKFQANQDVNVKKQRRAKFIRYSIYVWGVSAVPVCIFSSLIFWKPFTSFKTGTIALYLTVSPVVCIAICNTCFFISTALRIKQRKKETQHMIDGASKHQKENEQWFHLYVKLFIIMGGPVIIWAVAFAWDTEMFTKFAFAVEVLQAISTFLIFVWKDDVKRSFGKRFNEMMRRFGFCSRRGSTSTNEN